MKTSPLHKISIVLLLGLLAGGCQVKTGPPRTGRLVVRSEPMVEARVFLNGVEQDQKTDADFSELRPGRYLVRLMKPAPDSTGAPFVGEAEVKVSAGRAQRVMIELNRMTIVESKDQVIRPRTKGQKSIVDFFASIAGGELDFAYSFLDPSGRRAVGGSRLFERAWSKTTAIDILALNLETSTPDPPLESHRIELRVEMTTGTVNARFSGPPAVIAERRDYLLTTVADAGGFGLPKISEIRETTPTAGSSE